MRELPGLVGPAIGVDGVPTLAGTSTLRVDGVAIGCLTEVWRERALCGDALFEPDPDQEDSVRLVPGLQTFENRTAALAHWAGQAREQGLLGGWRDEAVVIRDEARGRPLMAVERALLRPLGLLLRSVMMSAWTRTPEGPRLWVARRCWDKPVDPGRLDALVGGGIIGFDDIAITLQRECAEEAGICAAWARAARPAGELELCYPALSEGLPVIHRERVVLHELELPPDFVPHPVDGEHASIEAMHPEAVLASIEAGHWTRDGAQASLDLMHRHRLLGR